MEKLIKEYYEGPYAVAVNGVLTPLFPIEEEEEGEEGEEEDCLPIIPRE